MTRAELLSLTHRHVSDKPPILTTSTLSSLSSLAFRFQQPLSHSDQDTPEMAVLNDENSHGSPTKSRKRARVDSEPESVPDAVQALRERLTPRVVSRSTTPDVSSAEHDLQFYDDESHEEYEWIRLPKKRHYDLFRVVKSEPQDRDIHKAQLPLTATRHDGAQVTLWAKMDTGADPNMINHSVLHALLGDGLQKHLRHMTEEEYNLIGANTFGAKQAVKLSFFAGHSKKRFENIHFIVINDAGDVERANHDGVPNVLLGWEFLQEHSMLQIDVEYCNPADPALPVLADKAENEHGGHGGPLPVVKVPKTAGVPRPKPR